jgi:hypothetical protein
MIDDFGRIEKVLQASLLYLGQFNPISIAA